MQSVLIRVAGQVQAVGFRAHVQRCAVAAGVRGKVWNEPDSGVGIIALHESWETMERFIQQVAAGPGNVASVTSEPYLGRAFDDFRVVLFPPE